MLNEVRLIGNVGKEPEIKSFDNSKKVANFSLATSEFSKDKDGNRKEFTEWHNIQAWEKTADIVEKYVKKGSQICITGKIRTSKHNDKYYTNIICDRIILLGRKKTDEEIVENDKIPF